jgi:hypothetical protein
MHSRQRVMDNRTSILVFAVYERLSSLVYPLELKSFSKFTVERLIMYTIRIRDRLALRPPLSRSGTMNFVQTVSLICCHRQRLKGGST